MKFLLHSTILFLLNVSNCSSPKTFQEIKFGEGGGFTGAVTEYEIKSNGDLFVNKSLEKTQTKIKTIDKDQMKTIQEKVDKISSESWQSNHPFNVYYFIETDKGKITWGDPSFPATTELQELFDYLNKTTKQ